MWHCFFNANFHSPTLLAYSNGAFDFNFISHEFYPEIEQLEHPHVAASKTMCFYVAYSSSHMFLKSTNMKIMLQNLTGMEVV